YTIGVKERRRYRGLVTDVSFRRLGFRIWSGCRSNPLGVARCCPHLEAVVKQMTDDPATEKPGSAENRYEPAMAGCVVFKVFCQDAQACLPARFGHSRRAGTSACCGVPPCQRAARSPEGWVSSVKLIILLRRAAAWFAAS